MIRYGKRLIIGIILLLLLFYGIDYLSENWRPFDEGRLSYSKNIGESKKRNVFIAEYNFHLNSDTSFGFVYPVIEEVWMEKAWKTGGFKWDTKVLDERNSNNRICIRINNPDLKRYDMYPSAKNFPRWYIDKMSEKYSGFTNWDSILINDSYANNDSLVFPLNLILNSSRDKEQIGELILIKR